MKKWVVFGLLFVAVVALEADNDDILVNNVNAVDIEEEIPAKECDHKACKLPECRCSTTDIPGGLKPKDTPQFVTVTFDDAINVRNIETYRRLLYKRRNSNGCPGGATFYISHEYTNYQGVNELYNEGFEIALHSITHQTPQNYWYNASYDDLVKEFVDQKTMMAHFANITISTMKGLRMPFLQMTGNTGFKMMADNDLLYDCSWPTVERTNPGLWPYTLHYRSTQECIVPPCPNATIPGPWVMPMVTWTDMKGLPCSFVDACFGVPNHKDEDGWFNFMQENFERHYKGNRAPFGFFLHEWFLSAYPAVEKAMFRFLNLINNMNDVFMVNSQEVIQWVKNPVPYKVYKQQACRTFTPTDCRNTNCGPLSGEHNNGEYWMQICTTCPRVYPWLDNPLGQ